MSLQKVLIFKKKNSIVRNLKYNCSQQSNVNIIIYLAMIKKKLR